MADKIPLILARWDGGENTEDVSDDLQANELLELENMSSHRGGSIRKDDGAVQLGEDDDDEDIAKLVKAPNRNGTDWLLKFSGANLKIYDSVNGIWPIIKTSLTIGEKWGDNTRDNVLILVSLVDDAIVVDLGQITRLDGAILLGATTIDLVDASQLPSSGTMMINDTAVTYSGKSSNQITGCSGAVATPDGYIASSLPTTEASIPKGSMCIDFGGRLIIAGVTGSGGATIYGSKATDREDFTIAGSGANDAFAEVLPAKVNSIRMFYDDSLEARIMAFLSNNEIWPVNVEDDATLGTLVFIGPAPFKQSVTAINHFSTLVAPNDIFHIDLDNQVRTLGPRTDDGSGRNFSDSISGRRKSDFRDNYDFSDASAAIANNEYWLNCKKGGGDNNNRFLIYRLDKGAWRSRTGLSASDVIEFGDRITIADAVENKVYQITPNAENDDSEAIFSRLVTQDINYNPMVFERLQYVKIIGKMSSNCENALKVLRDFGSVEIGSFVLSGSNTDITSALDDSGDGSHGSVVFGSDPFGTSDGDDRRFFIAMLDMKKMPDLENFRITIENEQPDVYLEIFKIKPIYGQIMKETYIPSNYILDNNNE